MKYLICFLILSSQLLAAETDMPFVDCRKVMELTGAPDKAMKMPSDVAVDRQGRVYVVDSGNQRVLVYTSGGEYLFSFGSKGDGPGELNSPVGISTAPDGRVLVADRGNKRIEIFDRDGKFLKIIPATVGKMEYTPVDVAVDREGKRIYVTGSAPFHRVFVLDNDGKLLANWGKPGNNEGEFRYPATIAVSQDEEEIHIVDVFNSRVQVFDPEGNYLVSVGSWGVTPSHLFRPKGVAVTKDNRVLVSDSYLGVVQMFNSDTRFRGVLGIKGEIARFDTPAGMAVDGQNRIYIAEVLANKISVFQLGP